MGAKEYKQCNGYIAEVIRTSRKKTASIKVDDAIVSIVVPQHLPEEKIDDLLKRKNRWIKEKISKHRAIQPINPKQYLSGEAFPYLGRNYRLKVLKGEFTPVKFSEGRLIATLPDGDKHPHMVRNALVRWYNKQAEPKLIEKTRRYAQIVGVEPDKVGIKTYKARWGSCNSKGHIDYNWKLIMAPHSVIDYVVVHELCHLKHFNHSKNYWHQVERIMPEYREHQAWLKANSKKISF